MAAAAILVVEDDTTVAESIRDVLVAAGYLVPAMVTTGAAALEAAVRHPLALVIMDVGIDGPIDGIETAEELRKRSGHRVVYLTGFTDDATLRRAKETDPLGYLRKPFNARELRIAVELALHQAALESALAARERWFATTLRSIGDAVLTTDGNEQITFVNHAALAILGVSEGDAIGKRFGDVVKTANIKLEN